MDLERGQHTTYRRQKELSREKLGLISNFSGAINGVNPVISTVFFTKLGVRAKLALLESSSLSLAPKKI